MTTEKLIFGFVDLRGESGRPSSIGMDLLHQAPVRFSDFRIAGTRLNAKDLVGFVRVYAERARRRASPARVTVLDVVTPAGLRAVEITFQEP